MTKLESITNPQIKKIHTMKSILKMSDEIYEALLFKYGVESSKELSKDRAIELIDELEQLANESKPKGKATQKQIDYIFSLWGQVSDKKSYSSLKTFIKRALKRDSKIEDLSVKEAQTIINSLKSWKKREESKITIDDIAKLWIELYPNGGESSIDEFAKFVMKTTKRFIPKYKDFKKLNQEDLNKVYGALKSNS